MNRIIQWIVFVCIVTLCGGGILWFVSDTHNDPSHFLDNRTDVEETNESSPVLIVDENHQRFVHPRYGFSVVVPKELVIQRFDEGQGTETIIFEPDEGTDDGTASRFQIFVTPYLPADITEDRIRKDIPVGEVSAPQVALLGPKKDIEALLFTSTSDILGESREVWFVRNGYLFEITSPIAHDEWLADTLTTLQFTL